MQTRNPILDELAKMSTSAMGLAQAAGEQVRHELALAVHHERPIRCAARHDQDQQDHDDQLNEQTTHNEDGREEGDHEDTHDGEKCPPHGNEQ